MKISTYLSFDGNARQAFEFYRGLFGTPEPQILSFGDAPGCDGMPLKPHERDRVMHACIDLGGHLLMATDATESNPHPGIRGAHVVIEVEAPEEAERLFAALAEGGQVEMPIGETFWALRYGIVTDRFGVPWMVNCPQPAQAS